MKFDIKRKRKFLEIKNNINQLLNTNHKSNNIFKNVKKNNQTNSDVLININIKK